MSQPILLANARVIDPANGIDDVRDVLIADGRIADPVQITADTVRIDCTGRVVCPGFIDLHAHLREPGQTHKEDIATGTRAAAAGGFTTVVAMPNTTPPVDCPEVFRHVQELIAEKAVVHVIQTACLSKGRGGTEVSDIDSLAAAGVTVITDDGSCIQSAAVMLEALKKAKENGLRVIEHCEDCDVCAGGAIHYGAISEQLGVPGQRRAVEELIVARDIVLADEIGWGVHIQHISTKGSVEMVRDAQARGLPITAEASPHHLALTDRAVLEHGPNAKMNPPLRDETDRKAVIQGLRQGTIQSIATDHAPHAPDEKSNPLTKAPAGILGFETAFPVCNAELVGKGHLGLSQLIAALTSGPRQILGLEAGTLSVGARADVLVLDPRAEHVVNAATSYSKSRNTPFDGQKLKGQVLLTLVDGEAIYSQLAELPGKI